MKIHYDDDCPPSLGEPVAVIGYGSQGRAHALNLRDSGEDVRVGLYPGSKSIERVEADGLRAVPVPEAVSEATVVMILTPDAGQGKLFRESVEAHLQTRSGLVSFISLQAPTRSSSSGARDRPARSGVPNPCAASP